MPGLAAAISAGLVATRKRRRRTYVPGSGRRDDLLVVPVVRELHLAHLRTTEIRLQELADDCIDISDSPPENSAFETSFSHSRPVPETEASDPIADTANDLAIDRAQHGGLGLVGPGAKSAARALILDILYRDQHKRTARVVMTIATATDLLLAWPQSVSTIDLEVLDADRAFAAVEEVVAERINIRDQTGTVGEGPSSESVLLVTELTFGSTGQLQAIVEEGARCGIGAIILGQWQPGTTCYVNTFGTITATSPGGEAFVGATFGTVPGSAVADIVATVSSELLGIPPTAAGPDMPCSTDPGDNGTSSDTTQQVLGSTEQGTIADGPAMTPSTSTGTAPTSRITGPPDQPVPGRSAGTALLERTTQPATAPVQLKVFGVPTLTWTRTTDAPTTDITGAISPRQQELLVLLAINPDGISRDRLVDTLWPHAPRDRPYNALNTALTRLRRTISDTTHGAIGEVVATSGRTLRLDPARGRTDYRRFQDGIDTLRAANAEEQRTLAYEQIIDAYTGDLGEGIDAEWLEIPREIARRDALDAATALARQRAKTDLRETLALLERARTIDPYNEEVYRDIMRVQRRLGREDAVKRTLELLTARLSELGERPLKDTTAIAHDKPTQDAPARPEGPTKPT